MAPRSKPPKSESRDLRANAKQTMMVIILYDENSASSIYHYDEERLRSGFFLLLSCVQCGSGPVFTGHKKRLTDQNDHLSHQLTVSL